MTEPEVALLRRDGNMEATVPPSDGDEIVVSGRKLVVHGRREHPTGKILVFMGVTDPRRRAGTVSALDGAGARWTPPA